MPVEGGKAGQAEKTPGRAPGRFSEHPGESRAVISDGLRAVAEGLELSEREAAERAEAKLDELIAERLAERDGGQETSARLDALGQELRAHVDAAEARLRGELERLAAEIRGDVEVPTPEQQRRASATDERIEAALARIRLAIRRLQAALDRIAAAEQRTVDAYEAMEELAL